MKTFLTTIAAMCLLALPGVADAFCIYNESDSQLDIYAKASDNVVGSKYFSLFRATIEPGKNKCCSGNEDSCDGEHIDVYCSRHGQTAAYKWFAPMRHGWVKVRCVRDAEGRPYRMEVIEYQQKPGRGQCPPGYTRYGSGDRVTCIKQ